MASKWANDLVMDAALDFILTNGNRLDVCAGHPATYADATTTYDGGANTYMSLADVALTTGHSTDGSTDYSKSNGATTGRRVTVARQDAIPVDASATADHIAITDTVNLRLIYVTQCTAQAVTAGGTVDVPAWDITFADPT